MKHLFRIINLRLWNAAFFAFLACQIPPAETCEQSHFGFQQTVISCYALLCRIITRKVVVVIGQWLNGIADNVKKN